MTGEPLFLGVDGGGTHCRAVLVDSAGRVLGTGAGGPANIRLREAALAEIMKACGQAFASAGLGEGDRARTHAGFGLAGAAQEIDRSWLLAQPHAFSSLTVDNDAYAAWFGAFGGADGAILIVGTGSCGLAVIGGRRINVGGWGADIGDDGSGMAIGRMAIRRALWAMEGMAPMTPLAEEVLAFFKGNPESVVQWARDAEPADYGRFAPSVFAHAERGDGLAVPIVETTAVDISRLVSRLVEVGADKVAMIGGIWPGIMRWLPATIRSHLIEPAGDGAHGGVLMARRASARVEG
jgi:glucosamine kinase